MPPGRDGGRRPRRTDLRCRHRAGALRVAEAAFVSSMLLLLFAVASRLGRSTAKRPPELMFIGFGLVLGLVGGVRQLGRTGLDPFADA